MLEIVEENPLVAVFFYDDSKASAKVCLIKCIHECSPDSLKLGFRCKRKLAFGTLDLVSFKQS